MRERIEKGEKLLRYVEEMAKKLEIQCGETIFQSSHVSEYHPEFMDECMKIAGIYEE